MDLRIAVAAVTLTFCGVLILVLSWLWLYAPGKPKSDIQKYKSVKFAHRGLHGDGVAENSLTAFRLARDKGYGIELDVRLSKDGELVVFHDQALERVTGVPGKVVDKTVRELSEIKLSGTEDTVPTFKEVLELIEGRVPLLIEIKQDVGESGVAERFIEEIEGYNGEFIVESFNPLALRAVKKARPDIIRGILSMEYMKDDKYKGKLLYRQLERLRFNFLMRPHFIAYDKSGHSVSALCYIRKNYGIPLFAWTVRSEEEEKEALKNGFDTVIFEGYLPQKSRFTRNL